MYNKAEKEEQARLTLGIVCRYPIDCMACKDKPDLQDAIHSYGVEVVLDCYENEMEIERFAEKIWNTPYSEIELKKLERLKANGGSIKAKDNKIVRISSGFSAPNDPKHLIDVINGKIIKLNGSGYESFAAYGLYVFVETVSLFDSYVQSVINDIAAAQFGKKRFYKTIYLDGTFKMCICDMCKKTYVKKRISREDRDIIAKWSKRKNSISYTDNVDCEL